MDIFFGLVGVVGFMFGVYSYYKTRQVRRATIIYKQSILQTKNHPDVSLAYKDTTIDNLIRFEIHIINTGNLEIRNTDLDSGYELLLEVESILSVDISNSSRGVKPKINFSNQKLIIKVGYMNPSDYISLDVLCNSIDIEHSKLSYENNLIGGVTESHQYATELFYKKPTKRSISFSIAQLIFVILFTALLCFAVIYSLHSIFVKGFVVNNDFIVQILMFLLAIPVMLNFSFLSIKRLKENLKEYKYFKSFD